MLYSLENSSLAGDRRELRRGPGPIPVELQAFDRLAYPIRNRERGVGRDDPIASIRHGRIVSESAPATRIDAARAAIGDSRKEA